MFKKKIKTIQEIFLDSLQFNQKIKYNFLLSQISRDWHEIIGDPLFNFTKPCYIYKNTLYVSCAHNGIIQILNFKSKDVLQNLLSYDYNYSFKDIKFISGNLYKQSPNN